MGTRATRTPVATGTDHEDGETFDVDEATAEAYEQRFVPAIFAHWAPRLVEAAGVARGHDVLDVACGTGIVARTAVPVVGPAGSVTGVDLNPAMLAVAARLAPGVGWRQGDVSELPFDDERFDAVLCQMAMMFFPDPVAALAEMRRVTRSDGVVATLVPAALDAQPAYGVFVDIAGDLVGPDARSLLGAYWRCGDLDELTRWHEAAGLGVSTTSTRAGPARFAGPADFVRTEIGASPLAARIDRATIDQLCAEAADRMDEWVTDEGFEIPLVCHTIVADRP